MDKRAFFLTTDLRRIRYTLHIRVQHVQKTFTSVKNLTIIGGLILKAGKNHLSRPTDRPLIILYLTTEPDNLSLTAVCPNPAKISYPQGFIRYTMTTISSISPLF